MQMHRDSYTLYNVRYTIFFNEATLATSRKVAVSVKYEY